MYNALMKGNQDYKFHQHPKYLYTAMYSEMWIGDGGVWGQWPDGL